MSNPQPDQPRPEQPQPDQPRPEQVMPTFAELGLSDPLLAVLDELGYEEPTAIQAAAIPTIVEGRDVLGQAATGTGKTAAFSLPLLDRLAGARRREKGPMALVLAPTRELAMQVSEALHTYGRGVGARVVPVYGGQPIFRQLKELQRGVDVVVATPGRAVDHLERGSLDLSALDALVLDEADEMLDMGFAEELDAILGAAPTERQTLLFSATLAPRIARLAERHMTDPVRIAVEADGPSGGESPQIREVVYVVARHHKAAALARILDTESPGQTIVFARTRTDVDALTETMNARGYRAEALHGGMSQEQRDRVMGRLRNETADLLIATDVAARGLDVDTLTHVVNYALPQAPEAYVHRIGRVGRAGREGVAITLVEPREHRAKAAIERHTGRTLETESLPTVADLREHRLGLLIGTVREQLAADGAREALDTFRPALESLAADHDVVEVALAALKTVHDELHGDVESEPELPDQTLKPDGGGGGRSGGSGGAGGGGGGRDRGPKPPGAGQTRLWISAGREANVRPKNLVGAIAGESSLTGRDIGAIHISGRFSLVEVPEDRAEEVIEALGRTKIRGRKVHVKHDRNA